MARNKQKLINYHSLNKNKNRTDFDVSLIDYGEIAVRNNAEQPELYIKTGEGTYAIFADIQATNDLITAQTSQIIQDLGKLSGSVIAFSGEVVNNYATKEYSDFGDACVYSAATAYTENVSGNIQSHLLETYWTSAETDTRLRTINSAATELTQELGQLSGSVIAFSGEVLDNYATKEYSDFGDDCVYSAATAYTENVSGNIQSHLLETYWTSAETETRLRAINSGITELTQDLGELSSSVITFSSSTIDYIDQRLTNVYIYKGSVDYVDNLSAFTPAEVGDVYNVRNANGTEGEPGYTPEGTNYAWDGANWDALGGTIDLSNYVTVDDLQEANSAITELTQSVGDLSGSVIAFSGEVLNNYATKEYSDFGDACVYSAATAYTENVSGNIQSHLLQTYWTSAETEVKLNEINSGITELTQDLGDLSGSVIAFSGEVLDNYATKEYSDFGDACVYSAATAYTENVSGNIQSHLLQTYWTSAETEVKLNEINSGITELTQDLGQLSGRVVTHVEPLAESALQSFKMNGPSATTNGNTSTQCGAIAGYTAGGAATLDLSSLVINCGDF